MKIEKTNRIPLMIFLMLSSTLSYGNELIQKAYAAYNGGRYSEAVALYDSVAQTEGVSAGLLYNMGNASYKDGDDGMAMLCYQRAHRLDPGNSRINDNIRFLESKIEDINKAELKGKKGDVAPDPEGFFGRVGRGISKDTASDTWAFWGVVSFLLLISGVSLYLFSTNVRIKKIGFFSGIVMLISSVVFTIFALVSAHSYGSHEEVVLMGFKNELKEEPDEFSSSIGSPLHRGTVVKVVERETGADGETQWYKVKLNSSVIGWVTGQTVQII